MSNRPKVVVDRTTATANLERRVKFDLGVALQQLLDTAHECGFVITVDLDPQQPLAMGNYRMVGFVRGAR